MDGRKVNLDLIYFDRFCYLLIFLICDKNQPHSQFKDKPNLINFYWFTNNVITDFESWFDRPSTARKMKFSIKDFFSKSDQILNGKLHFLRSDEKRTTGCIRVLALEWC